MFTCYADHFHNRYLPLKLGLQVILEAFHNLGIFQDIL